ncbi:MAG: class I SAM-dependent methyltransferase [Anaerolineae bacterium]|nr:class I SAM-dependent methyltransferase [Anaerolineae bacterium]
MSDQFNQQPSPTARESSGILGLGRSSGQRSAEMMAGLRAELLPRPEYVAMARPAGRVIGGMLLRFGRGEQAKINLIAGRPEAFRYLITQNLQGRTDAHYVELASGFLPRPWQLAHEFPQLRVTEIDLPEVISEKQKRFVKAQLALPPNLKMCSADLGAKPLPEVLEGQKADVISAEGLLFYFTLDVVERIAAGVRQSLKPSGVFIADIMTKEAYLALTQSSKIRQAINIFRRNAGNWVGVVDDVEHARRLFKTVGYSDLEVHTVPEIAEHLPHVPKPLADVTRLVVARN